MKVGVGDISFDGKMILSISDKHMTIVPIVQVVNKEKVNEKAYSEFMINGKKKYALLWMIEYVNPNTVFTPFISVEKEVCNKIIKDYIHNYYGVIK